MYKKLLLSLVAIATISLSSFGQAPEGFKYQAVVRDAGNTILNNQAVGMQITIQEGSIGGTTVYQETFSPTTNAYGLVNLEIGSGNTTDDFSTIDWSAGPYFIETAIDATGGTSYVVMGTSQLMSVPYALHANTAENVTNDAVNDADSDSTNEMNTGVVLNGTDLEVTDGNGTIVTDLSSLQDGVTDADADSVNEIQNLDNLLTEGNDAGNQAIVNVNKIGIGTTNAIFPVDVIGIGGERLRAYSQDGFFAGYISKNNTREFFAGVQADFETNNTSSGYHIYDNTVGARRMVIDMDGNLGLGQSNPVSKLQISGGDVYIEDINNGVIMKSPNGSCWRVTVDDLGAMAVNAIPCP